MSLKQKILSFKEKRMKKKIENWEKEKTILKEQQRIKLEKATIKNDKKKTKLAFGKWLMIFLFVNFTLLELFTCGITLYSFSLAFAIGVMPDFTPLITLLGSVIGETLSFGIYCAKSKAENTQGGIIYETALKKLKDEEEEENLG